MEKPKMDRDIDNDILIRANWLLGYLDPPANVQSIDDLDLCHFVAIFRMLTGDTLQGWSSAKTVKEKGVICQVLINILADDVFGISLDHINGHDVMAGKRRSINDLLEIFAELTAFINRSPLSEIRLDDVGDNDSPKETEDVPNHIRDVLHRIECDAQRMTRSQLEKKSLRAETVKTECTQTTPICMKSSTTSPITWGTLLRTRYSVKGNQFNTDDPELFRSLPWRSRKDKMLREKVSRSNRCKIQEKSSTSRSVAVEKPTMSSVSKYKLVPLPRTAAPKKVVKPKKVLGSKVRRNSSSHGKSLDIPKPSKNSSYGPIDSEEYEFGSRNRVNTEHLLKLLDHAENIRSRRQEISRQIKELQEEENILKKLEVIMLKEIKLTQNMTIGGRTKKSMTAR